MTSTRPETTCVKCCPGGYEGYSIAGSINGSGDISVGGLWRTPYGFAVNAEGGGQFTITGVKEYDSCTGKKSDGTCLGLSGELSLAACDLSGNICIGGAGGMKWTSCTDPRLGNDEKCWFFRAFVKACVPVWRYCKTWVIYEYNSCKPRGS